MMQYFIPEIEVTGEVNILEHFHVAGLVWVVMTNSIVRDVNHGGVFYFVDCVVANDSNSSTLRD
jgi:hypothetical protein